MLKAGLSMDYYLLPPLIGRKEPMLSLDFVLTSCLQTFLNRGITGPFAPCRLEVPNNRSD